MEKQDEGSDKNISLISEKFKSIIKTIKERPFCSIMVFVFVLLSLYLKISEANIALNDEFIGSDAAAYDSFAKEAVSGNFTAIFNPLFNQLETMYLTCVYTVFGPNHYTARLIQILASFFIPFFLYKFTRRFFGNTAAFIAILLSLIHPYIVYYSAHLWTEFWLIFIISFMLYIYIEKIKQKVSKKIYFLLGVLSMIGAFSKVWSVLLGGLLTLFLAFYDGENKLNFGLIKHIMLPIVFFGLGAAIVLAPWSISATYIHKVPVLLNLNSGLNFYLGNNPEGQIWMTSVYKYDYMYQTNITEGNCGAILNRTNDMLYLTYREKCAVKYSTGYVLSNPGKFISKIYQFSTGYWIFPNLQAYQRLITNPTYLLTMLWFFWIFALIGAISSIQKVKGFLPFYLMYLMLWFFYAITVYLARYKAGTVPLDIFFAAGGLAVAYKLVAHIFKEPHKTEP